VLIRIWIEGTQPLAGTRGASEPSRCAPPGAGILDLYTADLDAAEPIVVGSAGSVAIAVVEACTSQGPPSPAACRQVTRGAAAARATAGATIRRERRSPPTEQRFRSVERPDGQPPAAKRPKRPRPEDIMLVEHAHQPGRLDPGPCRARDSEPLDHSWPEREERACKQARRDLAGARR
jgi:hypothetical protein